MARPERKALIERIEQMRGSRVIVYVTGDRSPWGAQIGNDAIRPLYDHLRHLNDVEVLDLFIYSRGGDIDVPWRIATGLRTTAAKWNVLVPFRANSAATLLALGADEIVMGPQAELGPIDPIMNIRRPAGPGAPGMIDESVNVEDVMSYIRFVTDRVQLTEQDAVAATLGKVDGPPRRHRPGQRLPDPFAHPGGRTSHARLACRTRRRRHHGQRHRDAGGEGVRAWPCHRPAGGADLGLPVVETPAELDATMWELLEEYEQLMALPEPVDPAEKIRTQDEWREAGVLAAIESTWGAHEFQGQFEVRGQVSARCLRTSASPSTCRSTSRQGSTRKRCRSSSSN